MATIPVFRTWVAGEVVTAAYFNANVRDAGNFFLSWPVFEGRQTVAQSLTSSSPASILLDTEDIDTDNAHSTVTNTDRYTPVTQGRFQVSGGTSFAQNATGSRHAEIWKNNTATNGGGANTPGNGSASARVACRCFTLFANGSTDFFTVVAFQNSGGTLLTAVSSVEQPNLSVRMVGTT